MRHHTYLRYQSEAVNQRSTDNTMPKRRTDNTMPKRRTDNTMPKRKKGLKNKQRSTNKTHLNQSLKEF
jgi:hypothetical protein